MDRESHFEEERSRMVQTQLLPRGITDESVLLAMRKVPRHRFVPADLMESAYEDRPLPIGESQTISQPYIVALMTQSLELKGDESVLEIGSGSGYQAAVLAELVRQVYTIERIEELCNRSSEILKTLGYVNVNLKVGDGSEGWPEFAPYDGIMVTAGSPEIPEVLTEQINEGGRIVIPVGGYYSQDLAVVHKIHGKLERKNVCGCVFVPLIGKYGWDREK